MGIIGDAFSVLGIVFSAGITNGPTNVLEKTEGDAAIRIGAVEGKTFFISTEKYGGGGSTWVDALNYCQRNGIYLAEIESEVQSEFLGKYLQTEYQEHRDFVGWTSGTDFFHEGGWYWLKSGRSFNYTNWVDGQPGKNASLNCMILGPGGAWSTHFCEHNVARALCEVPGDTFD